MVGGAAVTEEFHPGFRNSTASYTVSLLQPKVIADMRLADHGYRVIERPISNFLPLADGGYLKLGGGLERTQAEFARFSDADAGACRLLRGAGNGRRRAARPRAEDAAQCRRRAGGARRCRAPGPAAWRSLAARDAARPARPVHQVGARLARRLVRERGGQGRLRLRCRGRQLCQPRHARHRPMCCCTTSSAR